MGKIFCNLRVVLAERGLKITHLDKKTTVSRTTISNLFHNYSTGIQFDTLEELCRVLNCQPGDLFFYEDIDVDILIKNTDFQVGNVLEGGDIGLKQKIEDILFSEITCHIKYNKTDYIIEVESEVGFEYKINGTFKKTYIDFSDSSHKLFEELNFPYYILDHIKNEIYDKMHLEIESIINYWTKSLK